MGNPGIYVKPVNGTSVCYSLLEMQKNFVSVV